jgi:hypothetical protein
VFLRCIELDLVAADVHVLHLEGLLGVS